MITEIEIAILANKLQQEEALQKAIAKTIQIEVSSISHFEILRRSIDARSKEIKINLALRVYIYPDTFQKEIPKAIPCLKSGCAKVIVCGSGPAGLFAAIELLREGIQPIVLERGKNIHERKKDIALLQRCEIVNPDSNYAFGEGGAGTFSDGKLYTRSNKRGNIKEVLECFVEHGADPNILIDAHPHIGSDKLPKIVEQMRNTIINKGGLVYFNSKVIDFLIEKNRVVGVKTQDQKEYMASAVILATGHSARDIYQWFFEHKYAIQAKPFALGVRLEHPQKLIDTFQYHTSVRPHYLPPAEYSMVTQIQNRGVFSFCMCPGGLVIPATTQEGLMLVNGMSNSMRSSAFANAGMVVSVQTEDYKKFDEYGALAGVKFQENLEQAMFIAAGKSQKAPAQRMTDFVNGKYSIELAPSSYHLGLKSVKMDEILPHFVSQSLKEAFKIFENKKRGFLSPDAMLLGLESRTSSPVQILRDPQSMEHIQIHALYPIGEGAGYAGGITSSAIDGINCARKIAQQI
ncbi:MAG: NAD(P)/FAD-dependent oxidoreductase [Bacteroidales bacterium]